MYYITGRAERTMGIPVVKLDRPMEDILVERIKAYEQRYEMSSDEMAWELHTGGERETAEKLKWMFDYHALLSLNGETHTTGTPGTVTKPSMKSVSMSTSS